jgi:hypothetical protein
LCYDSVTAFNLFGSYVINPYVMLNNEISVYYAIPYTYEFSFYIEFSNYDIAKYSKVEERGHLASAFYI